MDAQASHTAQSAPVTQPNRKKLRAAQTVPARALPTPSRAVGELRRVRGVARDESGEIVALCNPYAHWQRVTRWQALREIDSRRYRYYVLKEGSDRKIFVTGQEGRLVLGADRDELDPEELGDCAETFEGFDELDVVAG